MTVNLLVVGSSPTAGATSKSPEDKKSSGLFALRKLRAEPLNTIYPLCVCIAVVTSLQCGSVGDTGRLSGMGESPVSNPVSPFIAALPGGETMEFVWIKPGRFTMGTLQSEVGRREDEGPRHEVVLTEGFYMGTHEVTQGEWIAVMGTVPWLGEDFLQLGHVYPAVYISWRDTQDFVRALNLAAEDSLYRLPTEAEWEYAARADGHLRWSFGDREEALTAHAWYRSNAWDQGLRYAQPVGGKMPNGWGIYDMHGNVSEWCQDYYGPYSSEEKIDPKGAAAGASRSVRGGAFNSRAQGVRSADRSASGPGYRRNFNIGFRIVRRK